MQKLLAGARQFDGTYALIVCAGFEERAPRGAELIAEAGVPPSSVVILRYSDDRHASSYMRIKAACERMKPAPQVSELSVGQTEELKVFISQNVFNRVVCDVTGLSRVAIFQILSLVYKTLGSVDVIYTEAEEYYPTKEGFGTILADASDLEESFFKLVEYESAEIMYSADSTVAELDGFAGHHLPNYPLMLVAFLTFKRSRLAAILREYEANTTILIKAVPVREDITWRAKAIDIINFDLSDIYQKSVVELETLDWRRTFDALEHIYTSNSVPYRFNFILAPLGSKMQTVGSWAFATRFPDVRVVTSTPKKHFAEKYSSGWRDTFVIDDLKSILISRRSPA